MKFLCDNCKAKYQIADDKVAGKTVRMKCRKCGHQIEVRAAVTESSVSSLPPRPNPAPASDARGSVSAPYAPRTGLATSLSSTKPRPPTAATPAPPQAQGSALAGAFQRQVEHAPQTVPYPAQGQGAVELSVTDEWYVAINGVPVGPVRISELRRKAASGVVTDDSLCWQEGLEEWRPIRAIPELATIVREAAQQNRPSLVNPEPLEQQRKSQPPPPRPAPVRPAGPAAAPRVSEPPRPSAPSNPNAGFVPSRSNVVPLHAAARISQSEDAGPMTAPVTGVGAAAVAFAAPQTAPLAPPMGLPAPPPPAAADPFALPPPVGAPAPDPFAFRAPVPTPAPMPVAPTAPSPLASPADPFAVPPRTSQVSMLPVVPAKKGVPIWFFGLFVVSFGGVAAFFFFRAPNTQVVVREVAVAAPSAAPTDTNDVPAPNASGDPSTAPTGSQKVANNGTGPRTTSGGAANPSTSAPKTGLDLKGLTPGGAGPDVGPNGPGGGPAGGGLDQAAVQKVVRDRGPAVRRKCWDTASADKSSVNVNVNVSVAGNGTVSGATATGDDPVVTKCIEGQVRSWSFPAPGAPTQVVIPFHFVRQ